MAEEFAKELDEMEDIFRKLCKIAAGIESDQNRLLAKVTVQIQRL